MDSTASDKEIARAYVRYYVGGGDASDHWAVEELGQLPVDDPSRVWTIIKIINSIPVENENWREVLHATLGCGPLEEIIVLHEQELLPLIIDAAATDDRLRAELSSIYQASISPSAWAALAQAGLTRT